MTWKYLNEGTISFQYNLKVVLFNVSKNMDSRKQ